MSLWVGLQDCLKWGFLKDTALLHRRWVNEKNLPTRGFGRTNSIIATSSWKPCILIWYLLWCESLMFEPVIILCYFCFIFFTIFFVLFWYRLRKAYYELQYYCFIYDIIVNLWSWLYFQQERVSSDCYKHLLICVLNVKDVVDNIKRRTFRFSTESLRYFYIQNIEWRPNRNSSYIDQSIWQHVWGEFLTVSPYVQTSHHSKMSTTRGGGETKQPLHNDVPINLENSYR